MPEVTLNLPGRDQKIEEYKSYLHDLAQAGISYTTCFVRAFSVVFVGTIRILALAPAHSLICLIKSIAPDRLGEEAMEYRVSTEI